MIKSLLIVAALILSSIAPPLPDRPLLSLWRLDCGSIREETLMPPWSDKQLPISCYLVRHGADYLLFDAGLSAKAIGSGSSTMSLTRSIADQLREIGLRPDQIGHVVLSHYHGDHTGQAKSFPQARLLLGAADLAALRRSNPPVGSAPSHIAPWIAGGRPMTALTRDYDVFGDGSVVVLATPGHTEGHRSLFVRLASKPVILTGDLWADHDEVLTNRMAPFSTSFADSVKSRNRVRRFALRQSALLVIGHDIRDIAVLPAFPAAAE